VKLYLKDIQNIAKDYKFFCFGETAIDILDSKIPDFYFLISYIEIHDIYKNFDNVYRIKIYPFSYFFTYKTKNIFLVQLDKKELEDFNILINRLKSYSNLNFIIPILYDINKGIFKNLKNCFLHYNKNSSKRELTYDEKKLYKKSRYIEYKEKDYVEMHLKKEEFLVVWLDQILKIVNTKNNYKEIKISILYLIMISHESSIIIEQIARTDFFIEFFPLLSECKNHYQAKEYHPEGTLYDHLIKTAIELESTDFALKLAAILHDIGKIKTYNYKANNSNPKYPNHATISSRIAIEYLKKIADYFPFYPDLVNKVSFLIENHMKIAFLPELDEKRQQEIINSRFLNELLKLLKADLKASLADLNIYKRVYSYVQKKNNKKLTKNEREFNSKNYKFF
ncbi:MAG: HD domain-containing protein, partial [Exilispira sp.]